MSENIVSFKMIFYLNLQILMIAYPILVKTMESVQTWSTTTNVIVWQDLMEQLVKTVNARISNKSCHWKLQMIYVSILFLDWNTLMVKCLVCSSLQISMSVNFNLVRTMELVSIWLMITNVTVQMDLMERTVQLVIYMQGLG